MIHKTEWRGTGCCNIKTVIYNKKYMAGVVLAIAIAVYAIVYMLRLHQSGDLRDEWIKVQNKVIYSNGRLLYDNGNKLPLKKIGNIAVHDGYIAYVYEGGMRVISSEMNAKEIKLNSDILRHNTNPQISYLSDNNIMICDYGYQSKEASIMIVDIDTGSSRVIKNG